MQVYSALFTSGPTGPIFLIVKKREFNNWWKLEGMGKDGKGLKYAQQGGNPHLVNQAGQWAFPGGRAETGNWSGEATREFAEETGHPFPNSTPKQIYKKGNQYALYVFEISDSIVQLVANICANVAPNSRNARAPANVAVEDWEISEAVAVPLAELTNYLGARTPISPAAQAAVNALPAHSYSQSIDWYGEMARSLQANFDRGLVITM